MGQYPLGNGTHYHLWETGHYPLGNGILSSGNRDTLSSGNRDILFTGKRDINLWEPGHIINSGTQAIILLETGHYPLGTGTLSSRTGTHYPLENGTLSSGNRDILFSVKWYIILWEPGHYPLGTETLSSGMWDTLSSLETGHYPLGTWTLSSGNRDIIHWEIGHIIFSGKQDIILWETGHYPLGTGTLSFKTGTHYPLGNGTLSSGNRDIIFSGKWDIIL